MTKTPRQWLTSLLLLGSVALASCGGTAPATAPTAAPSAAAATAAAPTTAAATAAPTTAAPTTAAATAAPTTAAATAAPTTAAMTDGDYTVGMVYVGTPNDGGWNQAHADALEYVKAKIPGVKTIFIDKVNPGDRPNVKVEQAIDELVSQGAKFVITNSAEFADGTYVAAEAHPDVTFLHVSGDGVLTGKAPTNVGNVMGRMEYGKMISGCAAALTSETGKISYVGPLIDAETRRLVNSAYLGAKHCWTTIKGKPAADLKFKVTWIGFWFNIPGVTLDPTTVANEFINGGSDVLMSGIDTTEALVEANKATKAGKKIFAVPYDFKDACSQAPDVCLGVPYFNWGPAYVKAIEAAKGGTWKASWDWLGPDPANINNPDTSAVGFIEGPALSPENKTKLDGFIAEIISGKLNLYTGPLNYQDGKPFLAAGEVADDKKIWYADQLLEGIEGQSAPKQ